MGSKEYFKELEPERNPGRSGMWFHDSEAEYDLPKQNTWSCSSRFLTKLEWRGISNKEPEVHRPFANSSDWLGYIETIRL